MLARLNELTELIGRRESEIASYRERIANSTLETATLKEQIHLWQTEVSTAAEKRERDDSHGTQRLLRTD